MHERDKAQLMLAVEDARDEAEQETEAIRETYQPIVDSLTAQIDAAKAEDENADTTKIEEQRSEVARQIRDLRDKTRQLRIVEAVQAQDQCGPMFDDFEIRARHDLPGSQYIAKSVTEQCQACMGDLLKKRVTALRSEITGLKKTLDALIKT